MILVTGEGNYRRRGGGEGEEGMGKHVDGKEWKGERRDRQIGLEYKLN